MSVTTKAIRYVLGILTGKTADYIKGWNDCHRHMEEEVIRLDDQLAQGESMYNRAAARIAELEKLSVELRRFSAAIASENDTLCQTLKSKVLLTNDEYEELVRAAERGDEK